MAFRLARFKFGFFAVLAYMACGGRAIAQEIIVAPIFSGIGGSTSYVRIFNPGSATEIATLLIRSDSSGKLLGQVTVSVPAKASPQWSISDLLRSARLDRDALGKFSLRMVRTTNLLAFQHVIYDSQNNFLQNATICAPIDDAALNTLGSYLLNLYVPTSAEFRSHVVLQNPAAAPVTTRLRFFDAENGADLGASAAIVIAPGETRLVSLPSLAEPMDLKLAETRLHINLRAEVSGVPYRGLNMAHAVEGFGSNNYLYLTEFCPVPAALP
ncbi:MAG: hypothetical protein AB7E79_12290 [Rhodospirillaceae bacterium]